MNEHHLHTRLVSSLEKGLVTQPAEYLLALRETVNAMIAKAR